MNAKANQLSDVIIIVTILFLLFVSLHVFTLYLVFRILILIYANFNFFFLLALQYCLKFAVWCETSCIVFIALNKFKWLTPIMKSTIYIYYIPYIITHNSIIFLYFRGMLHGWRVKKGLINNNLNAHLKRYIRSVFFSNLYNMYTQYNLIVIVLKIIKKQNQTLFFYQSSLK